MKRTSFPRFKGGEVFGRLTVLAYVGESKWRCQCSCGKIALGTTSNLRSGKQSSCGCYRDEFRRTHGKSKSSIYRRWNAMLLRCEDPAHPSYRHYGGRGITVCPAWHDFSKFYADVGDPPPGLSLDRIDVNKGYEPSNVRWADANTQGRNKRSRKAVLIENLSIAEIEEILAQKRLALSIFG